MSKDLKKDNGAKKPGGTGLVYSDQALNHRTAAGHPESPERYRGIKDLLEKSGALDSLTRISERQATEKDLLLVHSEALVKRAKASCQEDLQYLDCPDTSISKASYQSALWSVGCALSAVDSVMNGTVTNAFSLSRPPGHHAEKNRAMGFCLFNNVAIAAQYLRAHYKLDRVLVFDFDVHHGNGTQHIFENDSNIFFCSIHGHPDTLYPHTGYDYETGLASGEGATLNVPMSPKSTDEDYKRAIEEICIPQFQSFQPQFILLSAGFDAHRADPLGNQSVSESLFTWIAEKMCQLSDESAQSRVVSLLEGGYNLEALAKSALAHIDGLKAYSDK